MGLGGEQETAAALAQAAQHPGERGDGVRRGRGRDLHQVVPPRGRRGSLPERRGVGGPAQPLEGAGDGRGEMKIFE